MQKPVFTIELTESKMITPKVKHFSFNIMDNPEFTFSPGQFISLHFNRQDGMPVKRSYSIGTIPGTSEQQIEFAATHVSGGPGTEFLYNLKPGDTVMASGPYGKLTIREELPQRHILIGTGTGIVPYRSMLPKIDEILENNPQHSAIIILGVQNREEALYKDDFIKLTAKHSQYNFRMYYSRQKDNLSPPHEYSGYVQNSFADIKPNPNTDYVYLCGNPFMIEDAVNLLKEAGFESKRIIREKYYSKPSVE